MADPFQFEQLARMPAPGDNVAIASRRIDAGTPVIMGSAQFTISQAVLEGHRFAVVKIPAGRPLMSWGLPFGVSLCEIAPGDYLCNAKIIAVLKERHVDFTLPEAPNFKDLLLRYRLDELAFKPGVQVPRRPEPRQFQGFLRDGTRGVGTRNYIVILGTSSRTSGVVRALAERFTGITRLFPNVDGVVAVAHTEGGSNGRPNNLNVVLKTLAGFMVHSNVGAVLALDQGLEPVSNAVLQKFFPQSGHSLDTVLHAFKNVTGGFANTLHDGEEIIRQWLPQVNAFNRSAQPMTQLKVGLQCGGSDAFSGVSGNPLVGWMARELLTHGGSANLAETDELIGAEPYILSNVRDLATARAFLSKLERFQERAAWHGHTAEGNPSGGNNFRGLYNIALKSIGAARKKDPAVRLDHVIDYADAMPSPGFYFMDSPGNDLESIAGQVGSGCNMILFATGNGSITNFPFVPTIKVMTSTGRFQMLEKEMDVNAGRYLDGTPMDELGAAAFNLMVEVANGRDCAGEKAGHSQVQIWRDWRQTDASKTAAIQARSKPTGEPLPLRAATEDNSAAIRSPGVSLPVYQTARGSATDRVGLIVPTSLCSGQIARIIANNLNRDMADLGLRYVALAHTEGCGNSGGESERLFMRTMAGYLVHPFVERGLLLEHGCEKTHNDAMTNFLAELGVDSTRFGRASVQMDGGIDKVVAKVVEWFKQDQQASTPMKRVVGGLDSLRVGIVTSANVPEKVVRALSLLARTVVRQGGTIVIPDTLSALKVEGFSRELLGVAKVNPTLSYGQPFAKPGFHVMETETDHDVETLTGLAATGVEVILAWVDRYPFQGHPLVPIVQAASLKLPGGKPRVQDEIDSLVDLDVQTVATIREQLFKLVVRTAAGEYMPRISSTGNVDFQMTRGHLGLSL